MTLSRVIYVRLAAHHMKMSSTGIDNEKDWLSALQTERKTTEKSVTTEYMVENTSGGCENNEKEPHGLPKTATRGETAL